MYPWIVFLHMLSALGFILMHVVSAGAWFRLRGERNFERIRALQRLCVATMAAAYIFLALLLLTGTIAGYVRGWWGPGWMWLALGVFAGICILMSAVSQRYLDRIRRGARVENYAEHRRRPARPQSVSR